MSGGALELAMANLVFSNGKSMISGTSTQYNSGYTGILYGGVSYTESYSYPEAKYYDKYSFGTSREQRQRSKLGDMIKEVFAGSNGWYGNTSSFAISYYPWFMHGGGYSETNNAGIFYSYNIGGRATDGYTSRLIIAVS